MPPGTSPCCCQPLISLSPITHCRLQFFIPLLTLAIILLMPTSVEKTQPITGLSHSAPHLSWWISSPHFSYQLLCDTLVQVLSSLIATSPLKNCNSMPLILSCQQPRSYTVIILHPHLNLQSIHSTIFYSLLLPHVRIFLPVYLTVHHYHQSLWV